jgi:predicted CXXCH cytochrome family protein
VNQPPVTGACTSCHGSAAAQAHAAVNTTSNGAEACAVCHAAGRSVGIDSVHAMIP